MRAHSFEIYRCSAALAHIHIHIQAYNIKYSKSLILKDVIANYVCISPFIPLLHRNRRHHHRLHPHPRCPVLLVVECVCVCVCAFVRICAVVLLRCLALNIIRLATRASYPQLPTKCKSIPATLLPFVRMSVRVCHLTFHTGRMKVERASHKNIFNVSVLYVRANERAKLERLITK